MNMIIRTLLAAWCLSPTLLLAQAAKPADTKPKERYLAPPPRLVVDVAGYKTVAEAIKADPKTFKAVSAFTQNTPAFVGIELAEQLPVVVDIAIDSPAESTKLQVGDKLVKVGGVATATSAAAKDRLRAADIGDPLQLEVLRGGKSQTITITPRPLSKPFSTTTAPRAVLGIQSGDIKKSGGVEVTGITVAGPAQKAGVKVGDVLLKLDDLKVDADHTLRDLLAIKKPGDPVRLSLQRGEETIEVRATLQADAVAAPSGRAPSWDDRLPSVWKKPSYRLAVIGIEYPDQKHNEKIRDKDWEESLFSIGTYNEKNATGATVYGSMNDYYNEISCGQFRIEGKFVGWVEVSKKRTDYSSGNGVSTREKTALLTEALDKLLAKNKEALADFDGIFFLYAGDRVQTTRGGLYWPHRASVNHAGKRWPYFIVQEGGSRMTNISVFCHEFGHLLGLPDLYARPEVPGMEGVGEWCAMSQQKPNGRPQHFSAWCKEQLGWLKPTPIDPRVKQKLILAPIGGSTTECFKVMVKPDGSEYFLLENRRQKGFDKDLPAEGLLIWRVTQGNRTQPVFLEESHGVE